MGMKREEFANIVKAIKGAYPSTPIKSQEVFDEWYMLLNDMHYGTVSRNLQRHIRTNKFAPTIAELRGNQDKFNNFVGRDYDMDKLELVLLGASPVYTIGEIIKEDQ